MSPDPQDSIMPVAFDYINKYSFNDVSGKDIPLIWKLQALTLIHLNWPGYYQILPVLQLDTLMRRTLIISSQNKSD